MKVLIACETSGTVRQAFRDRGHDTYSCDLLPADDGCTDRHIVGDCKDIISMSQGSYWPTWDLIIMHPPCTALAVSGNRWYGKGMPRHAERESAIQWTVDLWELAKRHGKAVCMENPVGVLPTKPTQYVQPWQFGHGETKKTGLWLHNLQPLQPADIVPGREQKVWKMSPSPERWKLRSKTYQGIAQAMADQWG